MVNLLGYRVKGYFNGTDFWLVRRCNLFHVFCVHEQVD
jgi:hypothetical protein